MKKYFIAASIMFAATATALAQGGISLYPPSGNVCNPMQISVQINGNGFTPTSYLWNTNETSPVIEIINSGTYTCTITGYRGNSGRQVTVTRSATYNVLPVPVINPVTELIVCRYDTVRLESVLGYDNITWNNGFSGVLFEQAMNSPATPGSPRLDTMSVSYTASVTGICSSNSGTVVVRAVRAPDGVGAFYQNKMDIDPTDSIPAGLVLQYIYPVTYHMVFSEIGSSNVVDYLTAPGSRRAPASILTPGAQYTVETTPIINGITLCTGDPSTIGIASPRLASTNRLTTFRQDEGISTFTVYDVSGRILMEKQGEKFNQEWLYGLQNQLLIIQRVGTTTEIIKMQLAK